MNNPPDQDNPLGQMITPPDGPGTWIGKHWRALICQKLTMLQNFKITAMVVDSKGVATPQDAKIVMGRNGVMIVLPRMAAAGASSSSNVPFSGTTDPPGGLAAGNYVAGPTPSLYVNLNTKTLWVCTTAGTSATSTWAQISGGSSGGGGSSVWL
jgi:hypothetical protein